MILGRRWETGFRSFAAFVFLCRFFVSCFVCVYSFARCLCSENHFYSQAFFLRRITCSFSCHIQLSLRIVFRPPPHTARDPWDSPPSRNDPAVLLSGMLTGLFSTGSCRHFCLSSPCTYILADCFCFVNTFLMFLVNFFPENHCAAARRDGTKKRGIRSENAAFLALFCLLPDHQHRVASA